MTANFHLTGIAAKTKSVLDPFEQVVQWLGCVKKWMATSSTC